MHMLHLQLFPSQLVSTDIAFGIMHNHTHDNERPLKQCTWDYVQIKYFVDLLWRPLAHLHKRQSIMSVTCCDDIECKTRNNNHKENSSSAIAPKSGFAWRPNEHSFHCSSDFIVLAPMQWFDCKLRCRICIRVASKALPGSITHSYFDLLSSLIFVKLILQWPPLYPFLLTNYKQHLTFAKFKKIF